MCPTLFKIGDHFQISGYGACIGLGALLCFILAYYRAKKIYAINPDVLINAGLVGLIAGLLGAKIMYWITVFPSFMKDPWFYVRNFGSGFVVYGGLITGILAPIVYLKLIKKESFLDKLDLAVASIALAQGVGRIGCLLAGCCYGQEIPDGAWYSFIGITFAGVEGCEAPAGVSLIPTQIISAVGDFLLCGFLIFYARRERFRGETSVFYILLYAVGRFFVEMLRGDEIRGFVGPFSTSQFVSILMVVLAVVLFFVFRKMNLKPLRASGPYVKAADTKAQENAQKQAPGKAQGKAQEKAQEQAQASAAEISSEKTGETPAAGCAAETGEICAEESENDRAETLDDFEDQMEEIESSLDEDDDKDEV